MRPSSGVVRLWQVQVTCFLFAVVATADESPSAPVGRLNASFAVSQDGAATYTVPIRVPPGTAGVEPQLSLLYSHRQKDSLAGVGWSLGGLSTIQRCAASVEQDGFRCGVNYDSHDRFCLDGERLVNIDGGYPVGACLQEAIADGYYQDGAIYHTERESWRRVQSAAGSCGNGPCGFVVTDKRGWTWEYGSPNSSSDPYGARIPVGDDLGTVRVWAVNRIQDRNGNAVSFFYTRAPLQSPLQTTRNDSGSPQDLEFYPCNLNADRTDEPKSPVPPLSLDESYYPCRIDYTSNNDTGQRHVRFAYEARPDDDVLLRYQAGHSVRTSARLARVTSYVAREQVTDYGLCYDDEDCYGQTPTRVTSRSRIGSITQCGTDGTCLPATEFTYPDSPPGFEEVANAGVSDCSGLVSWADFDGDGRLDWICNLDKAVTVQLAANFFPGKELNPKPKGLQCDGSEPQWRDFNGDGRDDWLCFSKSAGQISVFVSTGTSLVEIAGPIDTGCDGTNASFAWTDFNADGLADWVCGDSTATHALLSNGTTLSGGELKLAGESVGCDYELDWVDFNGDQLLDWVCSNQSTNGGGIWVLLSTGTIEGGFTSAGYQEKGLSTAGGPAQCAFPTKYQWIDFNGDLLADFVCSGSDSNGATVTVQPSTGFKIATPEQKLQSWTASKTLGSGCFRTGTLVWSDVNGDGKPDLTCTEDGQVSVVRSTGSDLVDLGTDIAPLDECTSANTQITWHDFDGDGLSDRICANASDPTISILSPSFKYPDLIATVTNGLNGSVKIDYLPLSNPKVYSPSTLDVVCPLGQVCPDVRRMLNGQANQNYPVEGVESALYLASSYTLCDNAAGNTGCDGDAYSYQYSYKSGLIDFLGRGWLGFETVVRQDTQLGNQTTTTYNQEFPFAATVAVRELSCLGSADNSPYGLLEVDPLCKSDGLVLQRAEYDYYCENDPTCKISPACWEDNLAGKQQTAYPTFEPFPCVYQVLPSSRQVDYYTYGSLDLSLRKTYAYDGDGSPLTTVPLASGVGQTVGLGNLTQQVDLNTVNSAGDASGSDSVYTSFDYFNATGSDWLIGFVIQRTKSSDAAQSQVLKQTKTSYDYPSELAPQDSCKPEISGFDGTMATICQRELVEYETWNGKSCEQSSADPIWLETTFVYDKHGNRTAQTDPAGNTTTTEFDTTYHSFPKLTTWPNGLKESYTYDPRFGKPLTMIDPNLNKFVTNYDAFGRVQTHSGPDEAGNQVLLAKYTWNSDSDGPYRQTTRYTAWDGSTSLWSRTYLDGLGRPHAAVAQGPSSSENIVRKRTYQTPTLVSSESEPFYCKDLDCDDGNTLKEELNCGTSKYPYVVRHYNAYGRPSNLLAPFGSGSAFDCTLSQWAYSDSLTTTRTMGNTVKAGKIVKEPEATTQTTRYDYFDSLRRLVWSATPYLAGGSTVDPEDCEKNGTCSATAFDYDLLGRLRAATDPNGKATSYCLDSLDRKQSYAVDGAFSYAYTWDTVTPGQLSQRRDGLKQTISYTYDDLNRIKNKTLTAADGSVTQVDFSWDQAPTAMVASTLQGQSTTGATNTKGRLAFLSVTEQQSVERTAAGKNLVEYLFGYDASGRVHSSTVTLGASLMPDSSGSREYQLTTDRDPLGRPTEHGYPDGSSVKLCWDPAGRLGRLALYDNFATFCDADLDGSELASVSYPTYDARGRPNAIDYGNDVSASYSYDTLGRMQVHDLSTPTEALLKNVFDWDHLSQVLSITDCNYADSTSKACTGPNGPGKTDFTQLFTLTDQRLTEAKAADTYGDIEYRHDPGGNLSLKDKVHYVEDSDASGLPVLCGLGAVADTCPKPSQTLYYGNYDVNGNLVGATIGDDTWTYNYDALNRLEQVIKTTQGIGPERSESLTSQYRYNHRDSRIQKLNNQGDVTLYVGPTYEVTLPASGQATYTKYLRTPNGLSAAVTSKGDGTATGMTRGDTGREGSPGFAESGDIEAESKGVPTVGTYYYHQDHLGSTSLVTDAQGNETSRIVYRPFGQPHSIRPEDSDNYRPKFNGKELDSDSSLYYFGARYYDPQRGRFLTADTRLGGPKADTQDAWNRYAFALNNPATLADPSGHSAGSWFKHALHDLKKWAEKNWWQIALGVAVDALAPEAAPEVDAALAEEGAAEAASERSGGTLGNDLEGAADSEGTQEAIVDSQEDGSCGSSSFVAGTLILAENGLVPIDDIRVGERVWAWSEGTGVGLRRVTRASKRFAKVVLAMELAATRKDREPVVIEATPKHPFFVVERGWTEAASLSQGDSLLTRSGEVAQIADIDREEGALVHDLEVQGSHSYYVSIGMVLAKNQTCGRAARTLWQRLAPRGPMRVSRGIGRTEADNLIRTGVLESNAGELDESWRGLYRRPWHSLWSSKDSNFISLTTDQQVGRLFAEQIPDGVVASFTVQREAVWRAIQISRYSEFLAPHGLEITDLEIILPGDIPPPDSPPFDPYQDGR